jgi:hypothetical protein
MADEKKKENWLPWIVAAVAVFALLRNQQPQPDKPQPKELKAVVSQTLPSIRSAYKQAFLEAASKIESGEIKDQEQWTKFIADNAGAKYREGMDKVYRAIDELNLPVEFKGREKEIAKINREIAQAW